MITGNKIRLRDKNLSDARDDYTWHKDRELAYLDACSPRRGSFKEYLADYTEELRFYSNRRRHVFAVETLDGKHIGNCAYYDINELAGDAQLGIMIGDRDYWNKGYGSDTIATVIKHVFHNTSLKRIYLRTLESNMRAQRCFAKCGFRPYVCQVKNGTSFVFMEVFRQDWEKRQAKTKGAE
jgi:RimJ/RimL family protein N-acetyltransferase